ncbi:hypothetical protein B0T17DRAFT_401670 [Bombardia bombarda]|uniref:Uncharacterized protein n=1 Tax=Bombardia bombarda TaxID=252184 RepID=A0AA39TZ31_9PEZI|nr:hypothetical protein B0T17DRAFT_401670 [Bombardia bombarda]
MVDWRIASGSMEHRSVIGEWPIATVDDGDGMKKDAPLPQRFLLENPLTQGHGIDTGAYHLPLGPTYVADLTICLDGCSVDTRRNPRNFQDRQKYVAISGPCRPVKSGRSAVAWHHTPRFRLGYPVWSRTMASDGRPQCHSLLLSSSLLFSPVFSLVAPCGGAARLSFKRELPTADSVCGEGACQWSRARPPNPTTHHRVRVSPCDCGGGWQTGWMELRRCLVDGGTNRSSAQDTLK